MYNRHYCRIKKIKKIKKKFLKIPRKTSHVLPTPYKCLQLFYVAASCLEWDRRKPLCAAAGEGARVQDRSVQAPPSGSSLPSRVKTAPGWADCAPTRGWGLAIIPRKDSWKDRSCLEDVFLPGRPDGTAPALSIPVMLSIQCFSCISADEPVSHHIGPVGSR